MPKGKPVVVRRWGPQEDQAVILYATGTITRPELARQFGWTEDRVANILADERANAIREDLREKVKEALLVDVKDQLPNLVQLSANVLRKTLQAEISPIHPAKANQDRVALAVLKGMGYLLEESGSGPQGGLTLSPEQHSALVAALDRANQAREIDVMPTLPAEIIENG